MRIITTKHGKKMKLLAAETRAFDEVHALCTVAQSDAVVSDPKARKIAADAITAIAAAREAIQADPPAPPAGEQPAAK